MDNIRFLTEILTTEYEYWCVNKCDKWSDNSLNNSVWLICIPFYIRRNLKKDEILLNDLEKLRGIDVQNIPLSEDYPPFQVGTNMYNMTNGFPIPGKQVKRFLIDALNLNSKEVYDYKELLPKEEPICQ